MKKSLFAFVFASVFSASLFAADAAVPLKENEIEQIVIKIHNEANHGGYELLSVAELKQLIDEKENFALIDAHPEDQFNVGYIEGATNFGFQPKFTHKWHDDALGGTKEAYKELLGDNLSRKIVVYCGGNQCERSHTAALWTKELGYHHVYRVTSGIKGWQDAGFAVQTSKK
jgi:rhodanese-related sulfurtransferase